MQAMIKEQEAQQHLPCPRPSDHPDIIPSMLVPVPHPLQVCPEICSTLPSCRCNGSACQACIAGYGEAGTQAGIQAERGVYGAVKPSPELLDDSPVPMLTLTPAEQAAVDNVEEWTAQMPGMHADHHVYKAAREMLKPCRAPLAGCHLLSAAVIAIQMEH